MSFLWIILVQWAVVLHVPTGTTYTIILVQWVCLSKFHEWWEFEVPRYREELKARYGKVLSFAIYPLSLFEYFANSLLSLVPSRLLQKLAPTPQEVLREADDDDDYEAPGWVTSIEYEIPHSGLGWLCSVTYFCLYLMTKWATVGFYAALWGGGVRASMAQLLLVAIMRANQGRTISGGKTNFMSTNLIAMIPWQAVVGLFRLSEKVEDDAVIPSERVSWYSRWSLALRVFYYFIIGLLVYFACVRFKVSMGGVFVVSVVLAVGKAVLLWNDDNYKLETALALQQPGPQSLCWRVELKCVREDSYSKVNEGSKERQKETNALAFLDLTQHQLDARPARLVLIALFAVLGAVVGAVVFGYTRSGALAGFVLGCGVGGVRFGPREGVPMVYVVDSRILQWLVDSGIWYLVANNSGQMDIETVGFLKRDPPSMERTLDWAEYKGPDALVVTCDKGETSRQSPQKVITHSTGLKLLKRPTSYASGAGRIRSFQVLDPSYRLSTVSKAMLDRVMRLRLVRDDVIIGSVVPEGTIRIAPIDDFARVSREVIVTSNKLDRWPIDGPVQLDLRKPHEPVTFGVAQMKVRSDTRRTRHQVAIARVLELLADGAVDYFRAILGVALSFVCVAVAAWLCGPVAAGATACACVLACVEINQCVGCQ